MSAIITLDLKVMTHFPVPPDGPSPYRAVTASAPEDAVHYIPEQETLVILGSIGVFTVEKCGGEALPLWLDILSMPAWPTGASVYPL